MKTVGLIAEYNPFHNGHQYHIAKAKEITGADYAVVVMSGDFLQRGAPALVDKYVRTEMALLGGADLVLELPTRYACASAEYFSLGSVALLHNLGITDTLCFGSEEGNITLFQEFSRILAEEPREYQLQLKKGLSSGLSFPNARQQALIRYTENQEAEDFLKMPNNILGVEYCKALRMLGSSILPVTIKRQGAGYHNTALSAQYSSATAIRSHICRQENHLLQDEIPSAANGVLQRHLQLRGFLTENDFSLLVKYKLMSEDASSLSKYLDMSQELANRIYSRLNSFTTFEDFIKELKTKELTYTRISRALLHALLNIPAYLPQPSPELLAPYGRILGFCKTALPLLKKIKAQGNLTLISKAADAELLLSNHGHTMFCEDIWCADCYESVLSHKSGTPFTNEHCRQIIVMDEGISLQ